MPPTITPQPAENKVSGTSAVLLSSGLVLGSRSPLSVPQLCIKLSAALLSTVLACKMLGRHSSGHNSAPNEALMPCLPSTPSPSIQEPAPPAKAASVRPVPAEARDPRVKWSALFWTFALLCALVYGGQLGWVFYPGIALDDSGWRLLLQQKLFPFFLGLFATAGMPPQVAAERAAAAAAARSATISYYEAFVAIGGTFLLLLAFCFKSWWKYYWRF